MAAVILVDAAAFRAQCPAFANETTYPDATIEGYWDQAIEFVSARNWGHLRDAGRRMAINWMTAHLMALAAKGGLVPLLQAA